MAAPYRGLIQSGARTRLSLDGVKLALCMGVDFGEAIQHEPIKPLDQFEAAENTPIDYDVNFSATMVRVIGNAIKNRDGVVIFPRLRNILSRAEMTATIEDPTTGIVLATIQRVKCASYRMNIGARGIVLTQCEFNAITAIDESELA